MRPIIRFSPRSLGELQKRALLVEVKQGDNIEQRHVEQLKAC